MHARTRRLMRLFVGATAVLVLLAAAYLRLRGLDAGPIREDQSILLSIAMSWVNGGVLPLAANKSSAGIMNPPLIVYLLALPLFVQTTLTAVHLFQALLGLAAVGILLFGCARLFGWRVALIAALLFAVNPWAVFYSRFIWNPNPIPLFSTLLLLSVVGFFAGKRRFASAGGRGAEERRSRGAEEQPCGQSTNRPTDQPTNRPTDQSTNRRIDQPANRPTDQPTNLLLLAFAGLWLAAITQLHLSGLVLIPALGVIGLVFWRRWATQRRVWAALAGGAGLALLLYAPFLIYERAVAFTDLQATVAALAGGSGSGGEVGEPQTNAAAFLLAQDLATGDNILAATAVPRDAVWPWFWLERVSQLLFLGGLGYAVANPLLWRRRHPGRPLPPRQTTLVILAVWMLVPVLLYLRHTVYLQNYYFLYLFPAPFLAIALLLDDILIQLPTLSLSQSPNLPISQSLSALVLTPLLLLAIWQFHVSHTRLALIAAGEIEPQRQARYVTAAIDAARAVLAQNPGCDLIVLAEGGTLERASLAVLEPFLHPAPVRFVDANRGYIIPAGCAVYLTVNEGSAAAAWLAAEGQQRPEMVTAGPETWRFYEVDGSAMAVPQTAVSQTAIAAWQNGLALLAARAGAASGGAAQPGAPLTIQYEWLVVEPPPRAHYHFFNHFVDAGGNIVAQEDAPAIDSLYWRAGDRLVTQFALPLPPQLANGRYDLYLGQYVWPDLTRIPLQDQAGDRLHVTEITINSEQTTNNE